MEFCMICPNGIVGKPFYVCGEHGVICSPECLAKLDQDLAESNRNWEIERSLELDELEREKELEIDQSTH